MFDLTSEVEQYLNTALWSENLDSDYSIDDLSDDSILRAINDVNAFMNHSDLKDIIEILIYQTDTLEDVENSSSLDESDFTHAFWLSRNGHGTGFFDAEWLCFSHRELFQKVARSFGECDLYVGDDNKLYFA